MGSRNSMNYKENTYKENHTEHTAVKALEKQRQREKKIQVHKRIDAQHPHYQRNANQNHNEVPLHASQNGCYPKVYKQ